MIAHLNGTVTAIGATSVVLDIGGVGLEAQCSPQTTADLRLGETARLATSLVVREDSLTLYGFGDDDARDLFVVLQTASGIGPRLAQAVLAVLSPDEVRAAIDSEDLATLTRVPGIGRKGAQRMVLELKDKVYTPSAVSKPTRPTAAPWRTQVAGGLEGLGWSAKEAELACDRVAGLVEENPEITIAALMRAALQTMAK
ncbi:Holliday junction branch migration protein RuvA [Enemella sp. A6]|uniref:Holliday junction branch migration protein RuvA n=1 Tax=Enemella sp. A6 TaxID=3440152 RepID=UPI003EC14D56